MTAAPGLPVLPAGGEMGTLIAAFDWRGTAVGEPSTWSGPMRTAIGIMLDSRHPMLIWWGAGFTMFYNDAFMALAGDKHPAGLGARGDEMFAEIWPTIGPMLRHVLSDGEATWVDDQLLVMDRRGFPEETYWTYSYSPIRDADGTVLGVFTATNDTTARVVGARRLDTLRALGDVSAVRATTAEQAAVAALDALSADPLDLPFAIVCLRTGVGRDELWVAGSYGVPAGSPALTAVLDPERSPQRVLRTGEAVLATDLAARFPGAFPAPAGAPGELGPDVAVVLPMAGAGDTPSPGVVVLGTSPYRQLDDDYRAFLELVARQISVAVADADAYAAERRRNAALAELDRAKTEFFTGVSHEFRTPLTLMLGPIEELRADPALDTPRTRESLDVVHRNGLRLGRLVDSLLDFSSLQGGQVVPRHRPVDLAALTGDLCSAFRSAVLAAGLTYEVDCPDLGDAVHVDPEMWEKVVLNLVGNAFKYTVAGGIGVSQRREGDEVVLRVADTGAGIPAEHRDKVFDRFHRVGGTAARSQEGSGIGLALVRELVELHGGRVTVDSEPGVGSTFTVRLPPGAGHLPVDTGPQPEPAAPRPTAAEAFLGDAIAWRAPDPEPAAVARGTGRVLVVDDNADMRAYLRRLLSTEWDVDAAADGTAALAAAQERQPDLVVSDVMMPGLDGLALVAALRADPRTAQVPVVLLSARAGEEASVEGLDAGADDYLVKPFAAAELIARVHAHMRLGRRRREASRLTEGLAGAMAERSPALGWVGDAHGRVGHVNATWAEFTGGAAADQLGHGWYAGVHPDDLDAHLQRAATARVAGRGWESEYRLRRADGEYRRMIEHAVPIPADLAVDGGAVVGWVGSCVDITERHRRADEVLHEERERYGNLVAQVPVGIWSSDAAGATTFVNEHLARLAGRTGPAAFDLHEHVHPDDRAETAASWAAAVAEGTAWEQAYRIVAVDGVVRHVVSSARPLRDPGGAVTGHLGTTVDLTEQHRAEQVRREAATEHAGRRVSDAAAARFRAMVQGLAAIVWEADWDVELGALRFTFVSDRAEELLGHQARRWRHDIAFWPSVIHPDDRVATLAYTAARTAAGVDHDITYRAVAVDGRVVWLHQVVHVVPDPDGSALRAQGLTVDVTEQKRAERSAVVLAETGRLVSGTGTAEQRLEALARLVMHDLGDGAVVSLVGPDGLLRRVAVAHDDPEVERALLRIAPTQLPSALVEAFAPGLPVVVPITEDLSRAAARDESDADARVGLGATGSLVVPLIGAGRLVGLLGFLTFGPHRHYDAADLGLAEELGRRASLMLAADRQRMRERHMQRMSADLASAGSVAEAAQRLVGRLGEVLGAGAVSVYVVEPERGIRSVHSSGYSEDLQSRYATIRFDAAVPIAEVVRTGAPVWIRDRDDWERHWPDLLPFAVSSGRHAAATLPLLAGGKVVGTVGLSFPTPRQFPADEREFVMALVAQAASAFERAATADERRLIADTLQKSLLPATLPGLDRLALAARYLPGATGTQAGGDWYDVLPLDDGSVAIVVGDVVGQGARAAAVMGQLRSALAAYLLEGHGPVAALERLDRFAARVPGAAGSTVACLVLDPDSGELVWARAGHPPPMVTGPAGTRLLEDASGTVLAVRGRPAFLAGRARVGPGESIVLYTDGLVERRGEVIDDGVDRLAAAATRCHAQAPDGMTEALLAGALEEGAGPHPGPADDVALIVARLLPAPLLLELPAEPVALRGMRSEIQAWSEASGLAETAVYDLQLTVGEAAANSVEHAYRDRPAGSMEIDIRRTPDGAVHARVSDHGSWRPRPVDRGYRGRGLELIRDLANGMELDHGPGGTEVRFSWGPRDRDGAADEPVRAVTPVAGPTGVQVSDGPGGPWLTVRGDLDLAGVRDVRDALLAAAAGSSRGLTVDLRATTYLASAGVAVLVEAAHEVESMGGRLRLLTTAGGIVRHALALSGVDQVLDVVAEPPM